MREHINKTSPTLGMDAVYEKATKISKLPFYLNLQFVRFFWRQDKNLRAKICKVRITILRLIGSDGYPARRVPVPS